jgi:non-specific serine/threonine protein kinase/serine/threonine-protein kinase
MSPERWRQIEHWYHAALDQDADKRAAFLEHACAGDEILREEVKSLLACEQRSDTYLEAPALEVAAKVLAQDRVGVEAYSREIGSHSACGALRLGGATIGRYRILRLLGEGGMGAVYEAEQEQPRRTVALKILKSGMATPDVLRRFEQESQALGRLRHPGIAQIFEAGVAESGFGLQPYFAMEFIGGASLRDYADAHHLNTRQRLELMVKICEAVHHAHQRGIIHRDLKPSNILVDEGGQPRILDFGVARLTNSDTNATCHTDVGQIVGTLAYMSPEQVLADPTELDVRSDVYALGVILFELLTGRLPYMIGDNLHEAVRAIWEEDPAPLSSFARTYRGDIETIAGKALEKKKAGRYSSVAELGADIQRYLNDEPITARRRSAMYQVHKFTRRHKALVGGMAAVLAVLIANHRQYLRSEAGAPCGAECSARARSGRGR